MKYAILTYSRGNGVTGYGLARPGERDQNERAVLDHGLKLLVGRLQHIGRDLARVSLGLDFCLGLLEECPVRAIGKGSGATERAAHVSNPLRGRRLHVALDAARAEEVVAIFTKHCVVSGDWLVTNPAFRNTGTRLQTFVNAANGVECRPDGRPLLAQSEKVRVALQLAKRAKVRTKLVVCNCELGLHTAEAPLDGMDVVLDASNRDWCAAVVLHKGEPRLQRGRLRLERKGAPVGFEKRRAKFRVLVAEGVHIRFFFLWWYHLLGSVFSTPRNTAQTTLWSDTRPQASMTTLHDHLTDYGAADLKPSDMRQVVARVGNGGDVHWTTIGQM